MLGFGRGGRLGNCHVLAFFLKKHQEENHWFRGLVMPALFPVAFCRLVWRCKANLKSMLRVPLETHASVFREGRLGRFTKIRRRGRRRRKCPEPRSIDVEAEDINGCEKRCGQHILLGAHPKDDKSFSSS